MKNNVYIITGSSKGLGFATSKKLIEAGHLVIGISRTKNESYKNKNFIQYQIDFSKPFEFKIKKILSKHQLHFKKANQIILINNAAQISPIDQIQNLKETSITNHVHVNLTSAILMTSVFLNSLIKLQVNKVVVQITSGAAVTPYIGWSLYCASKAGLNMFNKVLAEQMKNDSFFKCFCYSPGVMDTIMQSQIRSVSDKKLPSVIDFKNLKKNKKLRSPDEVALDLIRVLSQIDSIQSGEIIRITG